MKMCVSVGPPVFAAGSAPPKLLADYLLLKLAVGLLWWLPPPVADCDHGSGLIAMLLLFAGTGVKGNNLTTGDGWLVIVVWLVGWVGDLWS
jgi:hypothetical protein